MFEGLMRTMLQHPIRVLGVLVVALLVAVTQLSKVRLDASSDVLLLRGDPDLEFYRSVASRYEGSDFLILTWEPNSALLSDASLKPLAEMAAQLEGLSGVESVTTLLDVPLLESPPLSLTDLSNAAAMPTLRDAGADRKLALAELTSSPLYRNLIVSEDGELSAIQVTLAAETSGPTLRARRDALRNQADAAGLSEDEARELAEVTKAYDALTAREAERRDRLVSEVREVAAQYRADANIFVGGVPMIAADMVAFLRADLVAFGSAIIAIMMLVLWFIFRDWRWVCAPIVTCAATVTLMLGLLGGTDWRMTVISSNFVAVLLIVTLSLSIHLIVRYRELELTEPDLSRTVRAAKAADLMLVPCIYTALTTVVAFASLVVAGIQPVIDFGWMMTAGIGVGFVLSFVLVPLLMSVLPSPSRPRTPETDVSLTRYLPPIVERFGGHVLAVTSLLLVLTAWGVSRLEVENRFIDYFKESTEIYQGMELIDARLGGTIPLDIVLYPPEPAALSQPEEAPADTALADSDDLFGADDDFFGDDPFADSGDIFAGETQAPSYWFGLSGRRLIDQVQDIVEARPESGKVLSLSNTFTVLDGLFGARLGSIEMALVQNSLPADVERVLVAPYFDPELDETRITVRAMETSRSLRRDAYLKQLRSDIVEQTGISEDRVRFTGLLVLYNNVLQSLFASQILTLGAVFLAIGVMFWALFRSLTLALLALAPNILAGGLVLGVMGLAGIPLDIMTITIAAIVVGIGVDNCIHYIHRFRREVALDNDYRAAMYRSHGSIGRAMFYTTLTVVIGFSMLTLSNFNPSFYFGALTVMAMVAAVVGALLLLPKLILMTRPFPRSAPA